MSEHCVGPATCVFDVLHVAGSAVGLVVCGVARGAGSSRRGPIERIERVVTARAR